MRLAQTTALVVLLGSTFLFAQSGQRGAPPASPAAQPQPGARGGGRGGVQVMTLTTDGWSDGGQIPAKFTQAGSEVSPPLAWSNVPDGVNSFVLVVHDVDAPVGNGTDDTLQWLVWNIPGALRSLPEGVPAVPQLPDGTRQISVTGPNYRGPGAPVAGPPHHYLFELFALDSVVQVRPVGASPAETRAAVIAGMAGHIRGKAVMVGLVRRAAINP